MVNDIEFKDVETRYTTSSQVEAMNASNLAQPFIYNSDNGKSIMFYVAADELSTLL